MGIEKLTIQNFKSIKNLEIDCKRVNLFIGKPNTGKSNILETFGVPCFVYHGHGKDLGDFVRFEDMTDLYYDHTLDKPITLGFDKINLKITFKDGRFTCTYQEAFSRTSPLQVFRYEYKRGDLIQSSPALKRFKFYRFRAQKKFESQKSEFLEPPNGNNLLAIIMSNKTTKRIVKDIFSKFGYRLILRPVENEIDVGKELEDVLVSIPYSLVSDTLQRTVFYLSAINSNRESLITFEEPEAHAFPFYTKYLAERIALDDRGNQYFIATHNPYFLLSILEKTPKEEVAVFTTKMENYETKVNTLTDLQKQELLEMGSDIFFNIDRFLGGSA